jgi:hypothetical protein
MISLERYADRGRFKQAESFCLLQDHTPPLSTNDRSSLITLHYAAADRSLPRAETQGRRNSQQTLLISLSRILPKLSSQDG